MHTRGIEAPADEIFATIVDVMNWPRVFPPMVHVEDLGESASGQRYQVWATTGDQVRTWITGRAVRPGDTAVVFQQFASPPPLADMRSEWSVRPDGQRSCAVTIKHDYRAADDSADSVSWISTVISENSKHELEALAGAPAHDRLSLTFADSVLAAGSVADAYAFIRDAGQWPDRLPHVRRVDLAEPFPDVQILEMDTTGKGGSFHTTKSVRVCVPGHRIAYKQQRLPDLLSSHLGCWFFDETPDGVRVTSQHSVVIDLPAVPSVLGPGATVEQAKEAARTALSKNSQITLELAQEFAESGIRTAP